jgi:hemolysin activation/secretion protein
MPTTWLRRRLHPNPLDDLEPNVPAVPSKLPARRESRPRVLQVPRTGVGAWMRLLLVLLACLAAPAVVQGAEPAKPDDPAFGLLEFRVEGNTVLPAIEIERAVYPHLGESRTIRDVEKARESLEKAYHAAGYLTVLVDIPEQAVEGGIVTLNVTEGRVERLRITGSRYYSLGRIRAQAPEVAQGNIPYFPEVQQQLGALNRSGDRKVTPVLRAARTPGAVEVDLKVEDRLPLHGNIELTDRYSANTRRLRLGASLRYDNLWQRDHSLTLSLQTSPQDTSQVKVLSASYLLPVPGSDSLVSLYAVRSRSDVASVGTLNVLGDGTILGARFIRPLPAGEGYYHSAVFGIDHKDFGETVNLAGGGGFQTPISYTPITAQYSATHQHPAGTTQFGATLNVGLRGLFGNRDEEFQNKRFRASSNFFAARFDLQRTQRLGGDWSVFGRVEAQLTGQPLISNEQFAAGGADTVRGYLESERLGDHALRASFELRSPALGEKDSLLAAMRWHAFVDAAELKIIDALPETATRYTLASFGLGLRLRSQRGLSIDLELAQPLKTAAVTLRGDSRLHLRMAYEF